MKISKLTKLAGVFFALALGTTTILGQGWRYNNRINQDQVQPCLNQILGLTDEQKSKIDELNKSHQQEMAKLREQRQSTADAIEKSEIRTTMLKNIKAHRDEVKSLLNADQQQEYDSINARGNYYKGQRDNGRFGRMGQGQGRQQFAGNCGYGPRGNRGGYGQGNGCRRLNQGCYRNLKQNN